MKTTSYYRFVTHVIMLVVVVILAISLCGCVEIGAKDDTGTAIQSGGTPPTPGNGGFSQPPEYSTPAQANPTVPMPVVTTGNSGGFVKDAVPIPPPDALNFTEPRNYFLNDPPIRVSGYYPSQEIYRNTYDLQYRNVGLLANVTRVPFIIDFHVDPASNNPNDCFFRLTVRDNSTNKIIAENGYGSLYSNDVDKHMVIRAPGDYHLNLYGNRITVTISIRTATGGDEWVLYTPVPTPVQPVYEEEEELPR
jgi:hypothetical protein